MEDKASKKITELAFEAATRHENTHTQKRKRNSKSGRNNNSSRTRN